jgi:integrase/recombinase XerD
MSLFNETKLSVRFYLYEYGKVKKHSYPIYCRVIYKRMKTDLSARMSARPNEWDFENGIFLSSKAINRYNNNKLLEAKDHIIKTMNELKDVQPDFTMSNFRRRLKGEPSDQMLRNTTRLIDFFDQHINECKSRPQEYGDGVLATYSKARTHLMRFLESKRLQKITLKELSRNFLIGFENYLLTTNIQRKNYAMNRNTATNYIKKLKAVVSKAIQKELLDRNPFAGYKIPKAKSARISYLTSEELEAIKTNDMGGNASLIRVRDIFLFSCYTGLRFSDASRLRDEDVRKDRNGTYWINIIQKKTKDVLEVPMLDAAAEIYLKYEKERKKTNYVLPKICHNQVNEILKTVAAISGITKRLHHHMARHTFATTVTLEAGIDLKTVSTMLGHSSIKSTEVYSRITKTKLTDTIDFLNKKLPK